MAQAILDLYTSNANVAMLEEGEISTTHWSGLGIDNVHTKSTTFTKIEGALQQATTNGQCNIKNCGYQTSRRIRMFQHIETNFVIYVCTCGYFSSFRDTTTKHGRTRHHTEKLAVMQADSASYHIAKIFIAGLPEQAPQLPVKPTDPRRDCIPRGRVSNSYRIPKVAIAAVATSELGSLRSMGDLASAKVPKGTCHSLMTRMEAKQRKSEIQNRLERTQNDIWHLNLLLASAKCSQAEDELTLAAADVHLSKE